KDSAGALERAGATDVEHVDLINADSGLVRSSKLDQLDADPGVGLVQIDSPVETTGATDAGGNGASPASLATLYPLIDGAPAAWAQSLTGAGIGVAVIDSGVHPNADMGNRLTQVPLAGQTDLDDHYGHGTFVASVIAGQSADGRYTGIAPGASVYALNVARS